MDKLIALQVDYLDYYSSIVDTAIAGQAVSVIVNLMSKVGPAQMYSFRSRATFISDDGTVQLDCGMQPSYALNGSIGISQTFSGSFTMPSKSGDVFYTLEYQATSGSSWGLIGTASHAVTLQQAGGGFDISTLLTSIMPLIMLGMVMGMVTSMTKVATKPKAKEKK